jgi:hypothetical protein
MPENFDEDAEIIIKIGSIYKIFVTVIIFGRELCFTAAFYFLSEQCPAEGCLFGRYFLILSINLETI